MANQKSPDEKIENEWLVGLGESFPFWQFDNIELKEHNLETRGNEEVNRLLREGWRLLHI